MKVSELTGATLDYWVAKAESKEARIGGLRSQCQTQISGAYLDIDPFHNGWEDYCPSVSYGQGGPLIEKYKIILTPDEGEWCAGTNGRIDLGSDAGPQGYEMWTCGPTPLIAICRAIVTMKYGEEMVSE